ncbi:MAG: hypothetical protein ACR2GH_01025 [Pseudonocardia sp.]
MVAYGLCDGRYVEVTRAEPGQRFHLTEPFVVDVDLADLASRTRPVDGSPAQREPPPPETPTGN